jgi:reactive intermediate/imine deaminase
MRRTVQGGPHFGLPFSTAVQAGDLVYASGVLATDPSGAVVGGDVSAQTRLALENLRRSFEAAGTPLENATALNVYLTRADDFAAMNAVYRTFWPAAPPTRTTVATGLVAPGACIEIAGVALRGDTERAVVHPASWARSPNPYSYGIRTGNTLFLSGLIARRGTDNTSVPGDVATQTRVVLDNAGDILAAAGMTHADVASARVYLTDPADFEPMNDVYRRYFPKAPPARATVKAGLMNKDHRVEITLVAVRDDSRQVFSAFGPDRRPVIDPNLSDAVRVGDRLYLSGVLGNTDATRGEARAQARETFQRIGRTLKEAAFTWSDVVDGICYITDPAHFPDLNAAYREVFAAEFPARATVVAGLMNPDALVEIMLVASK